VKVRINKIDKGICSGKENAITTQEETFVLSVPIDEPKRLKHV